MILKDKEDMIVVKERTEEVLKEEEKVQREGEEVLIETEALKEEEVPIEDINAVAAAHLLIEDPEMRIIEEIQEEEEDQIFGMKFQEISTEVETRIQDHQDGTMIRRNK